MKIKHVYGNVLKLDIPLTIKIRTMEGDVPTEREEPFYPDTSKGCAVILGSSYNRKIQYEATVSGNVAHIEDDGIIGIGTYKVTVKCYDEYGNPYRYMVRDIIEICDATIDAGIEAGVEFNAETYTLEGAVFISYGGGSFEQVQADWTEADIHSKAYIKHKPTNLVEDENYVHTDNNYTAQDKQKLAGLENYDDTELRQSVEGLDESKIDKVAGKGLSTNDFTNEDKQKVDSALQSETDPTVPQWAKQPSKPSYTAQEVGALPNITKYGSTIDLAMNSTTYVLTLSLKDQDGTVLNTKTVDLPIESVVVNGRYDAANKKIVLALQSGSTIDVPVGDLIAGLQTEITSVNMLDADLVDDTNSTHKFVTAQEKTTWNNKSDFSGSYNDLSDKPTIPAAQIQSDWNQSDNSVADYIKNKPMNVSTFTNDIGYLTQHQSLADYSTTQEMNTAIATATNDMATITWVGEQGYLTQHQDISDLFNGAEYDTQTKRINFKHGNTVLAYIDATAFIKDGMVSNVEVKNVTISSESVLCLVITFNTDAGKEPINIPISSIFDASNYYTKTEVDNTFVKPADLATVAISGDYTDLSNAPSLATVATTGDYDDLTNKPTIPTVPTNVSAFTNDTGYITKTVNDLVNYYLKSDTYTKTEVQQLISAIQQFTYQVVSSLPIASADTMNIIYLVPSADPQTQNVKDEYITIDNGVSATTRYTWEQIGSTEIDLSGYYTSQQTDTAITTALNTALADYTTTSALTLLLAGKQDVIDAQHKLGADLVDDTNSTNKFTNATEKQTWNGKQDALAFETAPSSSNKVATMADVPTVPNNIVVFSNDNGEGIVPTDGIRAEQVNSNATISVNADVVTVVSGNVGTSAITLQVPNDNLAHVWDILMTTDSNVSITLAMSNSETILCPDGFAVGVSKNVEISVIGVGTKYYLRYGEFA